MILLATEHLCIKRFETYLVMWTNLYSLNQRNLANSMILFSVCKFVKDKHSILNLAFQVST